MSVVRGRDCFTLKLVCIISNDFACLHDLVKPFLTLLRARDDL